MNYYRPRWSNFLSEQVIRLPPVWRSRRDGAMKKALWMLVVLALLAADMAHARRGGGRGSGAGGRAGYSGAHHHTRSGTFIGGGFLYSPWYLLPGVPYIAPEPYDPVQYVEQGVEENQLGPAPSYWYYCPEANSYYPQVQTCSQGWLQFVSEPR